MIVKCKVAHTKNEIAIAKDTIAEVYIYPKGLTKYTHLLAIYNEEIKESEICVGYVSEKNFQRFWEYV